MRHLSVGNKSWKRQHSSYLLVMDQNNEQLTFLGKSTGGHVSMRDNRENSNKCNLCDFALYEVGQLRTHLKIHSGEKPHKCNQCDNASSKAVHLRRHLKTHTGEKSNKCNQCDYASSEAGHLRTHLKTHSGEKTNKMP